jgi:hypothetical protein
VLESNPYFAPLDRALVTGAAVLRPSSVARRQYPDVSDAYIRAVHSVLTRKQSAPEAAAALEKELIRITGFKAAPPSSESGYR